MIDTCQANTMLTKFYSPNILATGSSGVGENSYSVRNILASPFGEVVVIIHVTHVRPMFSMRTTKILELR